MTTMHSQPALVPDQIADSPVIQIDRAAVKLAGRVIWSDVTLDVRPGEFIAVLGPNGAGKSTLLRAILGLLRLSEGQITVLGMPARQGNPDVGYVPQRHTFDADLRLRGRDLVRLGLDGTRWGLPAPWLRRLWGGDARAREAAERVDDVIAVVGAKKFADRPIGELSGGEQQRLLIAQALVTRPRVVLLDEPLDSLDLRNQQDIAMLVQTACCATGAAVLLVAHDVNPILSALNRVMYIVGGQSVVGTPDEIITPPILSRLYGTPVEVLRDSLGRIVVVGQPEGVSFHVAHSH